MSEPNLTTWPDLFVVKQFLTLVACRDLVAELSVVQADAATVYGRASSGLVDQSVRQTLRLRPSDSTRERIIQRLLDHKTALEQHFNLALGECEEPQFLRYREGDFFVAHQDGNTGLLRLDTESRLVSIVIFLSRESETPQPDAYCGGALVFTDLRPATSGGKFRLQAEPGTLVAFRAETTHEVTPVTHGERYSIVSWFR
ncbi:MAG TPA: 2OG-Fe(II) oxygenase [Pyrinomonadaceae bacterium]|nr:2OG-Fe(II) oxygenase [Pyrinomonadaceae bacterium]